MKNNRKKIKTDKKGVPFEITLNVYYYIDDEGTRLLSDEDMQHEFDEKMTSIRALFADMSMKEKYDQIFPGSKLKTKREE
tara:strand:+ start:307 stop:546 length:240 start_codon:yes stop_codon:yes gene_type:complete